MRRDEYYYLSRGDDEQARPTERQINAAVERTRRSNNTAVVCVLYKTSGACIVENEKRAYAIIIILDIYRYILLVCVCMQVRIGVDGGRTKSLSRRRRRRAASRRRRTHAAAVSI